MKLTEVRDKAFAMPLTDPAYPKGPLQILQPRICRDHLSH
jgi:acetoacetate decarboxylase